MTRRDRPGALPVPARPSPPGDTSPSGHWVPHAPAFEPFYCFAHNGLAVRNGHKITERGWYFVDAGNCLHGPFGDKVAARKTVEKMRGARTP